MAIIKDIEQLVPEAKDKCKAFLARCQEENLPVVVNETFREEMTQFLYYLQGRIDARNNTNIVKEFNARRKMHGFWELTETEAKSKVITWTLYSKHMTGKAFDAVPLNKDGVVWWNAPQEVWDKMGNIGEGVGLMWGGRWKNKDSPHFEIA